MLLECLAPQLEGDLVVELFALRAFARAGARLRHRFVELYLRGLQQRFALAGEHLAFLEELGGALKLDRAALELFNDCVDAREFLLEGLR